MKGYLKSNIKCVPLVWQWYAWSHLIAPHSAGANLSHRYIKVMESYLLSPQTHIAAANNPKLIGGPFLNIEEKYKHDVEQLLERTKSQGLELLELDASLKSLNKLLLEGASGEKLDNIYHLLPSNLKGAVELFYDANENPGFRIFEKIIYDKYYSTDNQSIVISLVDKDYRPFCLSTPYFAQEDEVVINLPFHHPAYNMLFESRDRPFNIDSLIENLQIQPNKIDLFMSFFDEKKLCLVNNLHPITNNDVRIRYFGHACVLIETQDVSILFDPVVSYDYPSDIPRYTFADLPEKIDYVVFTHNHQDHVLFETLLQIRHKVGHFVFPSSEAGNILDPSMKYVFRAMGFENLISLESFDEISLPEGRVISLPFLGEHGDLNITSKSAFVVELKGKKIFLGADSNNLDPHLYENIHSMLGDMDVIFIGLECDGAPMSWIYGPLLPKPLDRKKDKERSLSGSDFNKAWKIVQSLSPEKVYIYAMGQEPWLNHVMALDYNPESPQIIESDKMLKQCNDNEIVCERLFGKKEIII